MGESLTVDAADRPASPQARVMAELRRISRDPSRSREDRRKADRAYSSLIQTVRTSSIR